MEQYIYKNNKQLRYGYTTGSCAAAAAKAATFMLLTEGEIQQIKLMTPKGFKLDLPLHDICIDKTSVSCSVIKDGGDDPDATHGMKIYAKVSLIDKPQIEIDGGVGIGRVTKAGLKTPIGSAAINPVPLQMITHEVQSVMDQVGHTGGIKVLIYAPEGKARAEKTFNSRLGILGGISILGTSGIVEPMSEQAIIDTIKVELDMLKASGKQNIIICPGNYGLHFIEEHLGITGYPLVKYSNFLGETLDYINFLGFDRVLLVGHIGKLVKVAAGVMNTHSRYADARLEVLGVHTALKGYGQSIVECIMDATTTDEAVSIIKELDDGYKVLDSIMAKIKFHIDYRTKQKTKVDVVMFSDIHGLLGQTKGTLDFICKLKGEI